MRVRQRMNAWRRMRFASEKKESLPMPCRYLKVNFHSSGLRILIFPSGTPLAYGEEAIFFAGFPVTARRVPPFCPVQPASEALTCKINPGSIGSRSCEYAGF